MSQKPAKRFKTDYDYTNPNCSAKFSECPYKPHCGCHAKTPPSPKTIQRHEREVSMRQKWCHMNGLEVTNQNLFKAPGDDSNFVYNRKPWREDGSFDPSAIYSVPKSDAEVEFEIQQKKLWKESENWICRKCKAKVNRPSRPYQGGPEPFWWWWCDTCRQNYNQKVPDHLKIKGDQKVSTSVQPSDKQSQKGTIHAFFKKPK